MRWQNAAATPLWILREFRPDKQKRCRRCALPPHSKKLMRGVVSYFGRLTTGRVVLWCYAVWYAVNVVFHFDSHPRLWLTSIGLSAIIGTALLISTRASVRGTTLLDRWQVFRLYLMPFCVSSFAALVKDEGYVLVFPPSLRENAIGLACIAVFLGIVAILRWTYKNNAIN